MKTTSTSLFLLLLMSSSLFAQDDTGLKIYISADMEGVAGVVY